MEETTTFLMQLYNSSAHLGAEVGMSWLEGPTAGSGVGGLR